MIFSCGPSAEARLREFDRLHDWHPFFALWPRWVGDEGDRAVCAWMQRIERKGKFLTAPYVGAWWSWEYRLPPSAASGSPSQEKP